MIGESLLADVKDSKWEAAKTKRENQMGQKRENTVKEEKVIGEKEVLKIQDFVRKMGSLEKAKLAVEELARLKKSA